MGISKYAKKLMRSKGGRSDPTSTQNSSESSVVNENDGNKTPLSPSCPMVIGEDHVSKIHPNTDSAASCIPHVRVVSQSAQINILAPQVSRQTTSAESPISELWDQAYNDLRTKEEALIKDYEKNLRGNLRTMIGSTVVLSGSKIGRNDQMQVILKGKIAEVDQNTWRLKFSGKEFPVKGVLESVVGIIDQANEYISGAISTNPYASIAWAGVGLLLPLFLNSSKQATSLAKGMDYISGLIVQSSMRENLYSRRYELNTNSEDRETFLPSHIGYKDALKELYTRILRFQAMGVCYYSKNTASRLGLDLLKWDSWDSLLDNIQIQETAFCAINEVWKDTKYEEECDTLESRHKEAMNTWKSIGSDVSGLRKAIGDAQKDRERKELLDWLSSVDPSSNYNSARNLREACTGDWLIDGNEDFKHWQHATNSLLWLHGKAGSGKSVLSSSVIKYIQDSYNSDPQTALGFFYFSFNDAEKQTTEGMLRSLIKQLCCRRPNTPQSVQALLAYKQQGHHPDMETLDNMLRDTIHGFSDVYLIIDALDECPFESGERKKLLDTLRRIHMEGASENIHLFCTSRKESDIEAAISPLLSLPSQIAVDLSIYRAAVDYDIGLYIDKTLASSDYGSWPDSLKAEARGIMIENADGMFQYVSCQFEGLRKHTLPSLVRKVLKDLPKGLDATYDRILLSINPDVEMQVTSVLKWLAFSFRPLRLEELAEAFVLDPESAIPFDKAEGFSDPEGVLQYLPGLVITVPNKTDDDRSVRYGVNSDEIRLAHFSIKEYLVSQRIREGPLRRFSIVESDSHLYIAESCLAYHLHLTKTEFATEKSLNRFVLWEYAAVQWISHLEKVDRISWTTVTTTQVAQALRPYARSLLNMVRFKDPDFWYGEWDKKSDELASPLYYSSLLGAFQLAGMLIMEGADINAQGGKYGNGLQAAAYHGHENTVRLLVEGGADINARGGHFGNALQAAAAFRGYESIVEFLVESGAAVNAQGGRYGTALQVAAYYGNENTVRLLLDRGVDINAQGGRFENALQAAAFSGNESTVRLLLDRGADINAQGGKYGNALEAAAALRGNENTIRLLLDRGADINAQGGRFENALQAAAFSGNESTVRLLLDRGADINAQGGRFGNALQAAIDMDMEESIVQLLLSRGAKVDPPGALWEELLAEVEIE